MVAAWFQRVLGLTETPSRRPGDQRQENRRAVRHPIKVHFCGRSIDCQTINLSASGALIDRALDASVGATVQVEVSHLPRLVAARVARIGAHSTAIRFQSIEHGSSLVGSIAAAGAQGATQPRPTGRQRSPAQPAQARR